MMLRDIADCIASADSASFYFIADCPMHTEQAGKPVRLLRM